MMAQLAHFEILERIAASELSTRMFSSGSLELALIDSSALRLSLPPTLPRMRTKERRRPSSLTPTCSNKTISAEGPTSA